MVSSRDTKLIFERLIGRLLDGMIVPFIGAGVSYDAKHRGCIADLTRTSSMAGRVFVALLKKCQTRQDARCSTCVVRTEIESSLETGKEISFDKACELWEWSCPGDRVGESRRRCELVREILKIPEFANVEPPKAHYYIAFLAREGLIDEVITTNYDTCMEEAFCATFGFGSASESGDSPALVVRNLNEYRVEGGRKFANGRTKRRYLKVYKINGCASSLCKGGKDKCEDYCKNILLTEKDLQDWGKRRWARDLFRDRLRSRALLFSGFGSDEPQVRHTALQVCEEFSSEPLNAASIWDQASAPFIVSYYETLSFSQAQIMQAYAFLANNPADSETTNVNAFLGSDVKFFNGGRSSDKNLLPADLFWERLFQAVFWRLLRLACGRESAVVSFLLPVLPCASSLLVDTINWFAPQNAPDHICGRFPEMLELAEDEDKVIPLARWVERVRSIQPQIWRGLYHPLAERPVLIPAVLLLIYLMIGTYQLDRSDISWKELKAMIRDDASPLGLSVEGCYVFGDVPVGVYIAHRNVAEQVLHKVVCHMPTELTVAIQIVLSPYGARKHRLYFACGEHNSVKVVTVRQVSILELFGQAASVPEAVKRFRRTLHKTSLLIDAERSRVRERSIPI